MLGVKGGSSDKVVFSNIFSKIVGFKFNLIGKKSEVLSVGRKNPRRRGG